MHFVSETFFFFFFNNLKTEIKLDTLNLLLTHLKRISAVVLTILNRICLTIGIADVEWEKQMLFVKY